MVTQLLTANAKVATVRNSIPAFTEKYNLRAVDESVLNKVQKISPCKKRFVVDAREVCGMFRIGPDRVHKMTKNEKNRKV